MIDIKTSFEPISVPGIKVLILGSLPGDKSLEMAEYYGHPRNRFWKILSEIHQYKRPITYEEKKDMLRNLEIGLWDVAYQASRKGSLDSAITAVVPNKLESFISEHQTLRLIAFNGKKAEAMYDRHFKRMEDIDYVLLPSSSPANAAITFEGICSKWGILLKQYK